MSTSRTDMLTAARRYATAAFDLAVDAKAEAALVEEMTAIARAMESDEALAAALKNPLVSRAQKGAVLEALAAKASPITRRTLAVAAKGGRAELIPAIATALRAKLSALRGEVVAEVTSARAISAAVQKQIAEALSRATGKTVQLQLREDPSVLGGLAIQLGSLRLDATLAGALSTMRADLLATQH